MDSPLLPTFGRNRPNAESDQLLADMSMSDAPDLDDSFLPDSPQRSGPSSTFSQRDTSASSRSGSALPPHMGNGAGPSSRINGQEDSRSGFGKQPGGGRARFSLFAPPRPASTDPTGQMEDGVGAEDGQGAIGEAEADEGDETFHAGGDGDVDGDDQTIHAPRAKTQTVAEREDRLRESLYELRRMNEVFDGFLGALEAARGHNERLAVRVKQTSTLLDQYTAILGQAEHTQKLLSNPNWTGAQDDGAALEAEELARQRVEDERRLEAEQVAEAARTAEIERERRILEAESAKAGGARGGAARGRGGVRTVSRGRGTGIPTTTRPAPAPSGIPTSTSTRKPSTTTAGGTVGKYGHVQSSGYGPSKKA